MGAEIAERAERLSDDLLHVENAAFGRIEAVYAASVPDVRVALRDVYRRGVELSLRESRNDNRAAKAAGEARDDVEATVIRFLEESADLALEAIGDELTSCEDTLSDRYAGVAEAGVSQSKIRSADLRREALGRWQLTAGEVQQRWRLDWDATLRLAVLYDEPLEMADRRLFSPDPVRLIGQSGRGVWWRQVTMLQRVAREVEIELVNAVRLAAMAGMNSAMEAR